MRKNERTKKQSSSGITLIALVITIIVLLILAGVSISLVVGNNGVINQAQDAENKMNEESLKERVNLELLADEMDKAITGKGNIKDKINNLKESGATVEEAQNLKNGAEAYYVTQGNKTVTVYADGTVEDGRVQFWDGTSKSKPTVTDAGVQLNSGAELKFFADYCNGILSDTEKADFIIAETATIFLNYSIDLQGAQWSPIKLENIGFNGTFDGKNNFVKNVKVATNEDYTGFFGGTSNIIKNFVIKDSSITGGTYTGGIAAKATNIENCHNINTTVTLKSAGEGACENIGGVVAEVNYIKDCTNSGNIIANNETIRPNGAHRSDCGGVAAIVKNEAIGCINSGRVTGIGNRVGGVAAVIETKATDCHNSGEVEGGQNFVGGVTGYLLEKATIKNCSNTATVEGKGFYTGGVVGCMVNSSTATSPVIENCYNSGAICGATGVGGILGRIHGTSNSVTVQYCYNKGSITITGNHIGSIIGEEVPEAAGTNNLNNLYYLNTLNLKAIGGSGTAADDETNNVMSVSDNLNSYRDFVIWIKNK